MCSTNRFINATEGVVITAPIISPWSPPWRRWRWPSPAKPTGPPRRTRSDSYSCPSSRSPASTPPPPPPAPPQPTQEV
eukprot:6761375-Pyramimonas_sp.AAC.2